MKKQRMTGASGTKKRPARQWPGAGKGSRDTPVTPRAVRQTIRELKVKLARAEQRIVELAESAERDFLLDIFNRRGFTRELDRSIDYIKRYQAIGALILLDVDRLKPINDTFGHAAGDQVLKAVADQLTAQVRSSDVVGRLGGDEFGVLLWNLSEADARTKAMELEQAIDGLGFTFGEVSVRTGASTGVAILDEGSDAQGALEAADRAMYARKAQRRRLAEEAAVAPFAGGYNPLRSSGT